MKTKPVKIVITTGDVDGIGTEIASKALSKIKPQKNIIFYLWRSPQTPKSHLRKIDSAFERITVRSWQETLSFNKLKTRHLIDINSNLPPAKWVELTAKLGHLSQIHGMVTAPMSKMNIRNAKMKDLGHTDILRRVTKADPLYMGFLGKRFGVILLNDHIPIKNVSKNITLSSIENGISAAKVLRSLMRKKQSKKPICLLGLNPHAGERGLIGDEEQQLHTVITKNKKTIVGPLSADIAFLPQNIERFSVFIANYHDQGLVPFKALHGRKHSMHITIGLPFIRTSVDHGTAKDMFGRGRADYSSMYEALKYALHLTENEKNLRIK